MLISDSYTFTVADSSGKRGIVGDFGSVGSFETVVDTSTMAPNNGGTFTDLKELAFDGNLVVFKGETTASSGKGIYVKDQSTGIITIIMDNTTIAPGSGATILGFGSPTSISGSNIVFSFNTNQLNIIFLSRHGTLYKVLSEDDTLTAAILSDESEVQNHTLSLAISLWLQLN